MSWQNELNLLPFKIKLFPQYRKLFFKNTNWFPKDNTEYFPEEGTMSSYDTSYKMLFSKDTESSVRT